MSRYSGHRVLRRRHRDKGRTLVVAYKGVIIAEVYVDTLTKSTGVFEIVTVPDVFGVMVIDELSQHD